MSQEVLALYSLRKAKMLFLTILLSLLSVHSYAKPQCSSILKHKFSLSAQETHDARLIAEQMDFKAIKYDLMQITGRIPIECKPNSQECIADRYTEMNKELFRKFLVRRIKKLKLEPEVFSYKRKPKKSYTTSSSEEKLTPGKITNKQAKDTFNSINFRDLKDYLVKVKDQKKNKELVRYAAANIDEIISDIKKDEKGGLRKKGVSLSLALQDANRLRDRLSKPKSEKSEFAKNIVVTIEGSEWPEEVLEIATHYDSEDEDVGGADDNGTGIVTALEMMRLFQIHKPKRSIRFVFTDLEEKGREGAKGHTKTIKELDETFIGALVIDMFGYAKMGTDPKFVVEVGEKADYDTARSYKQSTALASTFAYQYKRYKDRHFSYENILFGASPGTGDHGAYWDEDLPAIFIVQPEDKPNPANHSPEDKIENMNWGFFEGVAGLITETAATLTWAILNDDSVDKERLAYLEKALDSSVTKLEKLKVRAPSKPKTGGYAKTGSYKSGSSPSSSTYSSGGYKSGSYSARNNKKSSLLPPKPSSTGSSRYATGLMHFFSEPKKDKIDSLIKNDVEIKDVNYIGAAGNTLLGFAAEIGDPRYIDYLVEQGADINIESRGLVGKLPLHIASVEGHIEAVKSLIGHGADVNKKNSEGKSALDIAIEEKHDDLIEFLKAEMDKPTSSKSTSTKTSGSDKKENTSVGSSKQEPADDNSIDIDELSTLFKASDFKEIDRLIEKRVKIKRINTRDSVGNTLMGYAAFVGNPRYIEYLFWEGADLNLRSDGKAMTGKNPLHIAAAYANEEAVLKLIELGVNVNQKSVQGYYALDLAVLAVNEEVIAVLLKSGADPKLKNEYDTSALDYVNTTRSVNVKKALKEIFEKNYNENDESADDEIHASEVYRQLSNKDFIKDLIENNVKVKDVNYISPSRKTLLGVAISSSNLELFNYIVGQDGINPNLESDSLFHKKPIHIAAVNNQAEMIRKLAELGVDVNEKSSTGYLALSMAIIHENPEAVDALLEAGADPTKKDIRVQSAQDYLKKREAGAKTNNNKIKAITVIFKDSGY